MRTSNGILAEYVRKKFPNIPLSFDFALYSLSERLKDFGKEARNALCKPSKKNEEVKENELL